MQLLAQCIHTTLPMYIYDYVCCTVLPVFFSSRFQPTNVSVPRLLDADDAISIPHLERYGLDSLFLSFLFATILSKFTVYLFGDTSTTVPYIYTLYHI